jgi:hypothetical protein
VDAPEAPGGRVFKANILNKVFDFTIGFTLQKKERSSRLRKA